MQISNCNAHPLRALKDAVRVQPRLAVQGARFIQALYELETRSFGGTARPRVHPAALPVRSQTRIWGACPHK